MKRIIYLNIGDCHVSVRPTVISTVLGSCVAVCLYDAKKRIGGMNHIFLPGKLRDGFGASSSYATNAMELLIRKVIQSGGSLNHLNAKVFGGARISPAIIETNSIGQRIVRDVFEFLHGQKIKILTTNLGGNTGRKILFHTDTGDAYLRHLSSHK